MSNFILNKIVKIHLKDPPWIACNLRNMIKRQNRIYKNYKWHWYLNDDIRVDKFQEDCNLSIQEAKNKCLRDLGSKLTNPNNSQKSYWKITNKLLNKHKTLTK